MNGGGKFAGPNVKLHLIMQFWREEEGGGIRGVAVKCENIRKNPSCEGGLQGFN